jgi:sugar phosphate isomerase/epimerase
MALADAALPALARAGLARTLGGVRLGAQTYSFRDLARPSSGEFVDVLITAMAECGITECEIFHAHLEPATPPGRPDPSSPAWHQALEAVRRWRLAATPAYFEGVRRRFDAAGIRPFAYNVNVTDRFTDDEIEYAFVAAKALGVGVLSVSTRIPVARRMVPFAERHRLVVAMHNHARVEDPDECATPESFATLLSLSSQYRINLDIGHFTAANYDAVAYLREHHAQVTHLHVKDRKRNQGENVPWGRGDTPIREVLQLLRAEKWAMPAMVEYEYPGAAGPVAEVKRCLAYARSALA